MCLACQLKSVRSTHEDLEKDSQTVHQPSETLKNENNSKQIIEETSSHLDGGCLAWTIVAASFMVSFLQDGFRDSFGLLLPTVTQWWNSQN